MTIGDIVIVAARENGHEFNIGQYVEIIDRHEDDIFACRSLLTDVIWWLTEDELRIGKEQLLPSEYWSGGIANTH